MALNGKHLSTNRITKPETKKEKKLKKKTRTVVMPMTTIKPYYIQL